MANAHANLGDILHNLGKLNEAESSTLKAISLNSEHSQAYYNMGVISLGLNNLENAMANL